MATKPPALGKKIDRFFSLRADRLKLEKQAAKFKEKENKVRDDLIIAMDKAKIDAAKGVLGTVSIKRPEIARAHDWPALFKWIRKNNAFEILKQGLNQSNITERYEQSPALAKKGIPGIDTVTVVKFSATPKRGA